MEASASDRYTWAGALRASAPTVGEGPRFGALPVTGYGLAEATVSVKEHFPPLTV